jgi:hypothetical protein
MRFRKGIHYPHPPRGRGRGRYHLSDAALRARRRNLAKSRRRSASESLIIKRLIWQPCFDGSPRPSQRTLARQLGVWPSYVCKVQKQTKRGLDALTGASRVTLEDLAKVRGKGVEPTRRFNVREPHMMTTDEAIAERRREAEEWKHKHLRPSGRGWFIY